MKADEFKHKYVSVLRCATWHVWPEQMRVVSNAIRIPIDEHAELFMYGSVHLVSYEKRSRINVYSAKESKKKYGPIIWRGYLKSRYLVGDSVIQATDEAVAYKLRFEHAYKGEIDIQIHFGLNQDVPEDQLKQLMSGVSLSVMALINIELGDLLTPVAPVRIMKLIGDGKSQSGSTFSVLARNRANLSKENLQVVVDNYAKIFSSNSIPSVSSAKLRAALELYAAHFNERTMSVRFLILIMVLEALTPNTIKSKTALDLLEQWKQQVGNMKISLPPNSDDYFSLEGLERELLFRRENSIRSQIKQFIHSVLLKDNHSDAIAIAHRAVRVYDQRSTLVHEGMLPAEQLHKAYKEAEEIVEIVLKAVFHVANNSSE